MNFIKHTNELLNESYYIGTHKSGLEVVVIPKDQMTLYATFATKYGSMDNTFKTRLFLLVNLVHHVHLSNQQKMYQRQK